ncbi:MAG TPA: asparagine synthase-related protein, partial [Chthonomonadaceae bacterium]|nr:asparagine synthase-related protein [Chthonomonadaceae bacterium]
MGAWLGYFGPCDAALLGRMLGPAAQIHASPGFGLGVVNASGEPACLTWSPEGRVTVAIGEDDQAGCSATVDPARSALILACDPFGAHGVYMVQIGAALWFASDLRLLRRHPDLAEGIDLTALYGYLCFSYVPTPLTIRQGVAALPAGSRREFAPGAAPQERETAWREEETPEMPEEAAVAALRRLMSDSVARQLGAQRDAAVFLSGGLDSSLVAALLCEAGARVHLFTLDFGPPFDAERPCAQQVADHLGRPLHVVSARPDRIRAALMTTGAALEQPFGDGVTVPLTLLGQAAAQHAGLVFNGEGGDQLFGGWANKPMIAAELYGGPGYDREAAYLATFHRFYGLTDALLTPRARAALGSVDAGAWIRPALNAPGFRSLLHRLRAANLRLKGAQNIAPRTTQLAAACGLRARSPFFDRALAGWTFTLPPERFLSGACEKALL